MTTPYLYSSLTCELLKIEIQNVISRNPFLTRSVNAFLLCFNEENFLVKKLNYCFELKEKASFIELSLIQAEVSKDILKELRSLNKQFTEIIKKLTGCEEPGINFFSPGEGPFHEGDRHTKVKITPK